VPPLDPSFFRPAGPSLRRRRGAALGALAAFVALSSGIGHARPLDWFSAPLRESRAQLEDHRAALNALGSLPAGQTAPQLGCQYQQLPTPPPVAPWVQVDLGRVTPLDRVVLVPAHVDYQSVERYAYGFPRRFRVDVSSDATFATFHPLLVWTDKDFRPPRVAPVVIDAGGVSARYIRVTVTRLAEENGWHSYALAEIMALRGNINVALGAVVTGPRLTGLPPRWHSSYLVDGRTPLGPPIRRAPLAEFDALFAGPAPGVPSTWMSVDLGVSRPIDEVRLHPLHSWQGADVPGYSFPLSFRIDVADREDFSDARPFYQSPATDFPNPGNNPVTLRGVSPTARFIRVVGLKPASPTRADFALSELEVISAGENVAHGRPVATSDFTTRPGARPPALLTDGLTSLGRLISLSEWIDLWAQRARLETAIAELESGLPALEVQAARRAGLAAIVAVGLAGGGAVALAFRARRRRRDELSALRTKLAHDLHDEIGSNLAAIAVISETATQQAPAQPAGLTDINRLARESADAMREVLWLVGARQEGGIDLAAHFQLAAARLLPRSEIVWREPPQSIPPAWPVEIRREAFLFFKEALANVARHARATRVELSARLFPDRFELTVADNGCGFLPEDARAGVGLESLRARAAAVGGSVAFTSSPGQGTRIVLSIPTPVT
jgi:signal transduction histidine kinase